MRVLVTGGAGFIGAALVARLLAEGAFVDVVDDGSAAGLDRIDELLDAHPEMLAVHQVDVRSQATTEVMVETAPEVVLHLAGQVDVVASVAEPARDASVNIMGTLNVLEASRRLHRPPRVVLAASGGSLYRADPCSLPITEAETRSPLSPYGISKGVAVEYLAAYRRLHGLDGCALALANVYGPGQGGVGEAAVVAAFVDALVEGRPLVVHGDGEQTRDLVYLDDVVDAFIRAATVSNLAERPCFYHVGTGVETSVNELARRLCQLSGAAPRLLYEPARPGEVRRSALDASLAATHLGWRPATSLDEGLRATLGHRRDHLASRPDAPC